MKNFPLLLLIAVMILLFAAGWRERNHLPFRGSGRIAPRLVAIGGLIVIGGSYVWWANRGNFK